MLVVKVEVRSNGSPNSIIEVGTMCVLEVERQNEQPEETTRYLVSFDKGVLPAVYVEHVRSKGFWSLVASAITGAMTKQEQSLLKGG